MSETSFILTLTSAPLPGIIAAVSTAIADLGGNIHETHQHWDRPTDRFFLRVAFFGPEGLTATAVEQALAPTAEKLGLDLKVVGGGLDGQPLRRRDQRQVDGAARLGQALAGRERGDGGEAVADQRVGQPHRLGGPGHARDQRG